jgi:hypothetical protein
MIKIGTLISVALLILSGACHGSPVAGSGTWETTLHGRNSNGHAVELSDPNAVFFYDSALNITWLANMNANGPMDWASASIWAGTLNIGGFTGWRLPSIAVDANSPGCYNDPITGATNCGMNVETQHNGQYSELAYLYYVTLGNLAYCSPGSHLCLDPQPNWGLQNTAYFQNFDSYFGNGTGIFYWYERLYQPDPHSAWAFGMAVGNQGGAGVEAGMLATAVRSGDVLQSEGVPEPTSLLLSLTAVAGLIVCTPRRKVFI